MGMWQWLGLEAIADFLKYPLIQKVWEGMTPVVINKISKSLDEHRGEVMGFIVDKDLKTIMRRLNDRQMGKNRPYGNGDPYIPGDEAKAMDGLTKLFRFLSEGSELEQRKRVFQELEHMDDTTFDMVILSMEHDVVRQAFLRALHYLKIGGSAAVVAARVVMTELDAQADSLAQKLNSKNASLRDAINNLRDRRGLPRI